MYHKRTGFYGVSMWWLKYSSGWSLVGSQWPLVSRSKLEAPDLGTYHVAQDFGDPVVSLY